MFQYDASTIIYDCPEKLCMHLFLTANGHELCCSDNRLVKLDTSLIILDDCNTPTLKLDRLSFLGILHTVSCWLLTVLSCSESIQICLIIVALRVQSFLSSKLALLEPPDPSFSFKSLSLQKLSCDLAIQLSESHFSSLKYSSLPAASML